jgi:hypothetical protein
MTDRLLLFRPEIRQFSNYRIIPYRKLIVQAYISSRNLVHHDSTNGELPRQGNARRGILFPSSV